MPRLPLILCALALVGATVSASLFFRIGNSKQILELRLADANARSAKLDADLAAANEQHGALKTKIDALETDLNRVIFRVATAETRNAQLQIDLEQTRTVLTVYEETARALAGEVASLREDLEKSRASNASPEAVHAYKTTIAELERQLALARNGAAAPGTAGASTAVFTSRPGRATILTVGPESSFVVLNFGSARGAALGQKLSVNQGPTEVATVLISDVRTNFSVAQVLPDTLRGVLQKGDSAVLLR